MYRSSHVIKSSFKELPKESDTSNVSSINFIQNILSNIVLLMQIIQLVTQAPRCVAHILVRCYCQ
jgi:hypothetical protein